MKYPAIGMIETNSIARGILVHDVMLKKAHIEIIQSNSICPGKYIVFITGDEADVEEAMKEIRGGSGKDTDPQLVELFEKILPDILKIKEKFDKSGSNS